MPSWITDMRAWSAARNWRRCQCVGAMPQSAASSAMRSGAFITRKRRRLRAEGGNSGSNPMSPPRAR
jgi:hypothetical protein